MPTPPTPHVPAALPAPSTFAPFTFAHALTVLACAGLIAALVLIGRRLRQRRPASLRTYERILGGLALAHWLAYTGYALQFIRQDPMFAIPLQMCDLASLAAALSLLTAWRPLAVLVYFSGLALSSQGFVTPTVRVGPESINFWFFWFAHIIIVGTAIYECAVRGLRPTARDLLFAIVMGFVYLAVTLPINIALDVNFGYTGPPRADGARTLADALGQWPIRVVWIVLLAVTAMTVAWLPWSLARRPR